MSSSRAEVFAALSRKEQEAIVEGMDAKDIQELQYDWNFWGRPKQLEPADMASKRTWLILAGRGFGKTRTGAEWIRTKIESGQWGRVACLAPVASDIRDVMVEGESGILATAHPNFRPEWMPSKNKLEYPNGAVVLCYPATEPDRLRGPQFYGAWCDELAAWDHLDDPFNAWTQLQLGLRLGKSPKICVTTTPRPIRMIRMLAEDEQTTITKGSTYDNKANLAPDFIHSIEQQYGGTRVGRQEIDGDILDDAPGALWTRHTIEKQRWTSALGKRPHMQRVVMGIDPATTNNEDSDETGIVIVAKDVTGQGHVLADLSMSGSPDEWARAAIRGYRDFAVDRIVGETNNGGDLIERVLRTVDASISYKSVRASRGKIKRAEPVAALYEQGRVWHQGQFPLLEDQMSRFTPDGEFDKSPDRADAMVWALTECMLIKRDPTPFVKVRF